MKVALVGQPNCGKSTIFNVVAGYRSATANFPGTTVRIAWSKVRLNGLLFELVDLPGIYSLTASNPAEKSARDYLLSSDIDLIVNVVDASLLSRSLELTLELRETGIPMVVCLNMMDDARRKGIEIDARRLRELLRLPVVETVARRGVGVRNLFTQVGLQRGHAPAPAEALAWHRDVEAAVEAMEKYLPDGVSNKHLSRRFFAIKLLEGEGDGLTPAPTAATEAAAEGIREELAQMHGRPADSVVMSERHDRSMWLFEQAAKVGRPRADIRVALDNLVMHPVGGYVFLLLLLLGFFYGVFRVGSALEDVLLGAFESGFAAWLAPSLTAGTLAHAVVRSVWEGLAGGAAIVLPYLVPLLVGLAFLEDVGYLPRVAYLMDGLLHRIGLHGTSTVPLMLGYGCSVPACMATRILASRRDRFLACVLACLVPCSARSVVILALVAFYLGPLWALGVYAFNIVVVILAGRLLARLWPEVSPGMILEVPRYQWPSASVVVKKVWLRLREFVVVSWPLLVGGSVVLGLAEYRHWDQVINAGLAPLTGALGLPVAVGTTLIFGVLRKELSLLMLMQALGTSDIGSVLSSAQILVFTLFITFYTPCLATLVALATEIGKKLTALAVAFSFALALLLGVAARWLLGLLLAG
ncbi:MAG: ferrous iron transport protein B [Acidobacteria bacterium]|nr:ferrous iron transport protein B [Acidobacteriota bacterium]